MSDTATKLDPTIDKKPKDNTSEHSSVSATSIPRPTITSDNRETTDTIPYNFDLDNYRVIHIPSDEHSHCSEIARKNQQKILA